MNSQPSQPCAESPCTDQRADTTALSDINPAPDIPLPAPNARQTTLDWGLYYATMGWSVVPVRPGEKIPAVKWQPLQSLSADAATIQGWFDTEPSLGIGLIQGRNAGTIVLDFDARDGGMETLAQLDAQGLPESVRAFTPGGGVQATVALLYWIRAAHG